MDGLRDTTTIAVLDDDGLFNILKRESISQRRGREALMSIAIGYEVRKLLTR